MWRLSRSAASHTVWFPWTLEIGVSMSNCSEEFRKHVVINTGLQSSLCAFLYPDSLLCEPGETESCHITGKHPAVEILT